MGCDQTDSSSLVFLRVWSDQTGSSSLVLLGMWSDQTDSSSLVLLRMWSDQTGSSWLVLLGVWSGDWRWLANWQRLGMRQYKFWGTEFGNCHSSYDRQACAPLPSTSLCLVHKISTQCKLCEIKPCSLLQKNSWGVESMISSFLWRWTKIETMNPPGRKGSTLHLLLLQLWSGAVVVAVERKVHLGNHAVVKEQSEVTHWMGCMTRRHILPHTHPGLGDGIRHRNLNSKEASKA